MVEVQGKGSSPNVAPAGLENAFTEEWSKNQTHYPLKEPQTVKPTCDLCGNSTPIWLAGHDQNGVQIYCCSNSIHGRHRFKIKPIDSKTNRDLSIDAHVGAILQDAKNMDAEASITKIDVGKADNLVNYAWTLKKKGKKENTIKIRVYYLEWLLKKGANLASPTSIETILCTEPMKPAQKFLAVATYKSYCKVMKILWEDPPKVDYQPREPFVPTTEEINQLIHAAGRRTATFLQVAATTGAREGEICRLRWIDMDSKALTISINDPEKGSSPRTILVPEKTIAMISSLPRKYGENIFNPNSSAARNNLIYLRRKLADIQKNPRFRQIHLHTFRHYYARKRLIETNNKPYVQYLLGHKSSSSTDRYTSFKDYPIEGKYNSAIALTTEDARRLVEDGWQYICSVDNHPLFRKAV
jgi:integrase